MCSKWIAKLLSQIVNVDNSPDGPQVDSPEPVGDNDDPYPYPNPFHEYEKPDPQKNPYPD